MINRANWLDVKAYLTQKERLGQLSPKTITRSRGSLRHLLEWADDQPFNQARVIDPPFPVYLLSARADGKPIPLSPAAMNKICEHARCFFEWARASVPEQYNCITKEWLDTLRPGYGHTLKSRLDDRAVFTIEAVRKVLAYQDLPEESLRLWRDRAALAFLFLSGARAGAFVTLPIDCIDIPNMAVLQDPSRGVATKNRKAARTWLFGMPDILHEVKEWDKFVRGQLPPTALWYCPIKSNRITTMTNDAVTPESRGVVLNKGIKELCARAGVEFKSAHKIRHGTGVFGTKHARTIADLKALSQNLMHENLETTIDLYGGLPSDDVKNMIINLGNRDGAQPDPQAETMSSREAEIIQVLKLLKQDPDLLKQLLELA